MQRLLIIILCLISIKNQWFVTAHSMGKHLPKESHIRHTRDVALRSLAESQVINIHLIEVWQDSVLTNLISVNYFNSLLVHTSRTDFPLTVPSHYLVKHVEHSGSFQRTISELNTRIRSALTGARQDLSRVHPGMDKVPDQLKTMMLLVQEGPFELLTTLFPDLFHDIEKLVNDSLVVLRKPGKDFQQVLEFLIEIDYLLNVTSTVDQRISLQVYDIKTQWKYLTELIIELAKQAERARESFILQFNWVLQEFIRAGPTFPDSLRQFIISLLLPKTVEIDRASDLLGMVTKIYSDISFKFTDEQIGGNIGLPLLSDEQERQQYLNQYRHDLPTQAVHIARLALKEHKDFLQRDKTRQTDYETYLAQASSANLTQLLRH